jgi:hypothetical protein
MIDALQMKRWFAQIAIKVSDFYKVHTLWSKVERALALHRRGEARSDGLRLTSARTVLSIEWLARSIHPWDRDLPPHQAERMFTQQCLHDTSAALTKLFEEIPVLDAIEVRVRRVPSQPPILFGTVRRDRLKNSDYRSVAMKLRTVGLNFQMTNMCLDEIEQR